MPDRPEENLKLDIEVAQKVMGWHHEDEAKWPDMEAWWFIGNSKQETEYLPWFSANRHAAEQVLKRIEELGLIQLFAIHITYQDLGEEWIEAEVGRPLPRSLSWTAIFDLVNSSPEAICKAALKAVEYREKVTNA